MGSHGSRARSIRGRCEAGTGRPAWSFQLSHGFLNEPEELEPGDVRRTTASASWTAHARRRRHGRDDRLRTQRQAGQGFQRAGSPRPRARSAPTRCTDAFEAVQVETDLLRFGVHGFVGRKGAHVPEGTGGVDVVSALTLGATRRIARWGGWDVTAGADATFYAVPAVLEPTHGARPVSFHLFLRVRPPAPMGRMIGRDDDEDDAVDVGLGTRDSGTRAQVSGLWSAVFGLWRRPAHDSDDFSS